MKERTGKNNKKISSGLQRLIGDNIVGAGGRTMDRTAYIGIMWTATLFPVVTNVPIDGSAHA